MKHIFFTCFLLAATLLQAQTALDTALQRAVINGGGPLVGIACGITHRDSVLRMTCAGYSDLAAQRPWRKDDVMPIGSVSKTWIGWATMYCIRKGLFTLDTPIKDLLPWQMVNPHQPEAVITVRHLATHTSGIKDDYGQYMRTYYPYSPDALKDKRRKKWKKEGFLTSKSTDWPSNSAFVREYLVPGNALYRPSHWSKAVPGAEYNYSNVGASLLAALIEHQMKMPFEQFCAEAFAGTIMFPSTHWKHQATDDERIIKLYDTKHLAYPTYDLHTWPDGGMRSTLQDLTSYLRFIDLAYHGYTRLIGRDEAREMFRPQFADGAKPTGLTEREPNSGICWAWHKSGEVGHTGGDPGVVVFLFYNPETRIGRVLMTNMDLEDKKVVAAFTGVWKAMKVDQ